MNAQLVAINAQYFHTSLAVRSIAAYCRAHGQACGFAEYTINQHFEDILRGLALEEADVYLFSCYIWNVELACKLAAALRKLYPACVLLAGGPQVSYHSGEFLQQNPAFDAVLVGEGEAVCLAVLKALDSGAPLTGLPGVTTREGEGSPAAVQDLDSLPFAYEDLAAVEGRILYYESMRGCPFSCSYCLSAAGQGVRYKSLAKVFEELGVLLAAKPRQVKFVDRTFNCSKAHALAVWRFLQGNDNGFTNFHFELAGELLDAEQLSFLQTVRAGLFQFEIGVQSCNALTLAAIQRPGSLDALFKSVEALQAGGNIHLHLDLIAGLPHEGFASFAESFNWVYAARPHQLQLGFLKVLPGSPLEAQAEQFSIAYTAHAPFEVLRTSWLGYAELAVLKDVAAMVELYYNSGRFGRTVGALCGAFPTPFAFYEALAAHYRACGHFTAPPAKLRQYELLGEFALAQGLPVDEGLQWLCRFDMALHEKPKRAPGWVCVDGARPLREKALAFYAEPANQMRYLPLYTCTEAKQLLKTAHIERFPFDPRGGKKGENREVTLLFDYTRRDITGRAFVQEIAL